MRYKGAVNYYSQLPLNPTQGDVWVVRYEGTEGVVPNGHAYCWDEAPTSLDPDPVLELQWIDLGNLANYLPEGVGKIYYNGICYSSGGGDTGDFFSRTQIATTTSNLQVLDNSTLTADSTINFKENLFLLYNSGFIFNESEWERNIYNNILDLSSTYLTTSNLSNNIINVYNSSFSITDGIYNSFIFGRNHSVSAEAMYNCIIGGDNNHILYSNGINSGNYMYETIMLGYNNDVYGGSSTDAAYILLGSYNQIYREYDYSEESYTGYTSWWCIGLGYYNKLSGYENYALGYYNSIGYSDGSVSGYGRSDQCGVLGNENDIVHSSYNWFLGHYNATLDTSAVFILGQSNKSIGGNYNSFVGSYNIIESYSTGSSYGYTSYNRVNNSAILGDSNHITTSEYGNHNYVYIVGYSNNLSSNLSNCYYSLVLGDHNTETDTKENTYTIGSYNNLNNVENTFVFGSCITLSNVDHVIRLGFYPLINDDLFAIGNGSSEYDWDLEEFVTNYSSIFRIDSSGNFYLNSTVPLPPVPTSDGSYILTVSSGTSSWTSGGGGGSTVIANPSGAATDSLTKVSIDNVIYSLSGSGTYVEANPSGAGSTDLTSVEIGSTIYNIPQGINVVANPSGTATTDLTKVEIGSTIYSIPEGTVVEANPVASATANLTKIQIGSTIYSIPIEDKTELTSTLTAGSTTLTFSNAAIHTTSMIDIYVDTWGVAPTNVSVVEGAATLTFEAQQTNVSVMLIIR